MNHNSSKLTVMKQHENNFMVGGHHNMRKPYEKGGSVRKVENLCSKDPT